MTAGTRKPGKEKRDRWERLGAPENTKRASWDWAGADDLQAAIVSATEDGAAVLLSKTSDGGALVLQLWSDAGKHKLYPTSVAELNEALALIRELGEEA